MVTSFKPLLAAFAFTFVAITTAPVMASTISSTIKESGAIVTTNADATATIGSFTFTNPAAQISDLTGLSLTLSIFDGDTKDYDKDKLSLSLDGINTGLLLNGFENNQMTRLTSLLSNLSANIAAQIYQALTDDSTLVATIVDSTSLPGNDYDGNKYRKNTFLFPVDSYAVLSLTGNTVSAASRNSVPEPTSLVLLGLGLAGLGFSRRNKA